MELGLTIPLQRHLSIKAPPYGQEPDRRFCWDLHVIILRGRSSLLAVHCHSRYTFVLYDLSRSDWAHLPNVFREGLHHSLSAAGFPPEAAETLCGTEQPLFTKTHGRREVAFLNRAWDDVMAAELALDESTHSQPLLDQIVNAKPSRCVGFDGLGAAAERLAAMELHRHLTPAILSYEGIQYQYMAPGVMETAHLDYLREHLRILSGFYGLLRPFDGVTPYRLEMQARLAVDGHKDLYGFWGNTLAQQLAAETDFVLNLASKEYSRAVELHLPKSVRFLTCTFGERKNGKVVEKGTMCKMARGQMVRWLAENNITGQADIRAFDQLGYRFHPELSAENHDVFLKTGT